MWILNHLWNCHKYEEGEARWYHVMLYLNNMGYILGEANGGATASKANCIAEFGLPTTQRPYPFVHHGSPEYTLCNRDLYRRVYQQDGDVETTIPWHFVRRLVEEEKGNLVNWARVAYLRMVKNKKGKVSPNVCCQHNKISPSLSPSNFRRWPEAIPRPQGSTLQIQGWTMVDH
jgi:hypothetical protein